MKNTLVLALCSLVVGLAAVGCSPTEPTADTSSNSSASSSPVSDNAEMVKCPCGKEVAKADAKEVNGTMMCAECAAKAGGGEESAMAKCEGCGAEVAKDMLVSHDGKMLCEACAAH